MTTTDFKKAIRRADVVVLAIAGAVFLAHLLTATAYPLYRDEFYYLDCAKHLDWGYVDHPPLSIAILAGWRAVFGDSVFAVRFLPAVAAALLIYLTALLAKTLGGGVYARRIAALAVAVSMQFRLMGDIYSMNAFDYCFWSAILYLLIRIARTQESRLWLPLGAVLGIGLMNKLSLLFPAAGVVVGMMLTPLRRQFLHWHFWAGLVMAGVLCLPYLLWQIPHHWATLDFMKNAHRMTAPFFGSQGFLVQFTLENNPLTALLWVPGLAALFFSKKLQWARFLGWTVVVTVILLGSQQGKTYYAAGLLPMLLATGAVTIEQSTATARQKWLRMALPAMLLISGIILAPFGLRLLGPQNLLKYNALLSPGAQRGPDGQPIMPEFFGDQIGWEELTSTVSRVYHELPAEEQKDCVILTAQYGSAGAINYYGPRFGLPRAYSTHNNYFYWGPPPTTPNTTYILVEHKSGHPEQLYDSVRVAAMYDNPLTALWNRNINITVLHHPKIPFPDLWQRMRMFR